MTIKYSALGDGRVLATIRVQCPYTKRWTRERKKFANKTKAKLYAEPRERAIAHALAVDPHQRIEYRSQASQRDKSTVPTIEDWKTAFLSHQEGLGTKPSWLASQENILDLHIIPHLGRLRLDEVDQDSMNLVLGKAKERGLKTNTRRNIGMVLKRTLSAAAEANKITEVPKLRLPKQVVPEMEFYSLDEYEELVVAAENSDPRIYTMILLGGDAGLRCGEIVALEVRDLIHGNPGWIVVRHQQRRGILTTPKTGTRRVPMTPRLRKALKAIQNLPGARVLLRDDGSPVSETVLLRWLERTQKAAGVMKYVGTGKNKRKATGQGLHKLRHTFATMAVKCMDVREVQELMGHANLTTTERYLHVEDQGLTAGMKALAVLLGDAS